MFEIHNLPIWNTVEKCDMQMKDGKVTLTAEINSFQFGDKLHVWWTIMRRYDNQSVEVGFRTEDSIEAAKVAAWHGMELWRDICESKIGDGLAPPIAQDGGEHG